MCCKLLLPIFLLIALTGAFFDKGGGGGYGGDKGKGGGSGHGSSCTVKGSYCQVDVGVNAYYKLTL